MTSKKIPDPFGEGTTVHVAVYEALMEEAEKQEDREMARIYQDSAPKKPQTTRHGLPNPKGRW